MACRTSIRRVPRDLWPAADSPRETMKPSPISKYARHETRVFSRSFKPISATPRNTLTIPMLFMTCAYPSAASAFKFPDFSVPPGQKNTEAAPQDHGALRRREKLRHRWNSSLECGLPESASVSRLKGLREEAGGNCTVVSRGNAGNTMPPRPPRVHATHLQILAIARLPALAEDFFEPGAAAAAAIRATRHCTASAFAQNGFATRWNYSNASMEAKWHRREF